MAEMLKIDNIKKTFNPGTINEKVALNGVNLSLEEGDFVTVIGGNGSRKIHHLKRHRRRVAGGFRKNLYRRR